MQAFWSQPSPDRNDPAGYRFPLHRSKYLYSLLPPLSKKAKILEVGCNVGRNLNFLFEKGYRNLYGIEINKKAVSLMRKFYPKLAKKAHIIGKPTEEAIFEFKDNYFDLIFTMASLMHHHPSSDFILKEIYKKSKKYILTIEDETNDKPLQFARNYKKIFESLGMKEITSETIYDLEPNRYPFQTRLFEK